MGLDHPTSTFMMQTTRMAPVSLSHLIFAQYKEIKVNNFKVGVVHSTRISLLSTAKEGLAQS